MLRRKSSIKSAATKKRASTCSLDQQKVARRKTAAKHANDEASPLWGFAGRLAMLAGLWLLVSGGLLAGWAWLSTNPAFAVQKARVLGTEHLSRVQVIRAAGVGSDSNLLALSVGKISSRLARLPGVEDVRVERRLPGTLVIEVKEKSPRLLALVEGQLLYLDRNLKFFRPASRAQPPDLPVVTGFSRADLAQPDEEALSMMASLQKLVEVLPAGDLAAGGRLGEIHLDRVWGVSLVYNDMKPLVRVGFVDFNERLANLKPVLSDLEQRGETDRAILIDLQSARRTVVRLAQGNV